MPAPDDPRRPPAQAFDVPDLDLPKARPSSRERGPRSAKPGTYGSFDDSGAASLDIDDVGGAPLDLDDGSAPVTTAGSAGAQAEFGARTFDADELGAGIDLDAGESAGVPFQTGTPDYHLPQPLLGLERRDAEALAGWGPPPHSILQAPLYAWRVFMGRRALRARVQELALALEAAELDRDRALAALVENVRPVLERDQRLLHILGRIVVVEAAAGERQQALEAANAEHAAEAAKLDARLDTAREELARALAAEHEAASELAPAELSADRADAKYKRALIELRNAGDAARRAAGLPPEQPQLTQALSARAAELQPECRATAGARDVVRARLQTSVFATAAAQRALEKLEAERRTLYASFGQELDVRAHDAGRAERARLAALAEIGRELLGVREAVPPDPTLAAAIESTQAAVLQRVHEHEAHLHALDACDEAQVSLGWALIAAVTGALLVAVTVLLL